MIVAVLIGFIFLLFCFGILFFITILATIIAISEEEWGFVTVGIIMVTVLITLLLVVIDAMFELYLFEGIWIWLKSEI